MHNQAGMGSRHSPKHVEKELDASPDIVTVLVPF